MRKSNPTIFGFLFSSANSIKESWTSEFTCQANLPADDRRQHPYGAWSCLVNYNKKSATLKLYSDQVDYSKIYPRQVIELYIGPKSLGLFCICGIKTYDCKCCYDKSNTNYEITTCKHEWKHVGLGQLNQFGLHQCLKCTKLYQVDSNYCFSDGTTMKNVAKQSQQHYEIIKNTVNPKELKR